MLYFPWWYDSFFKDDLSKATLPYFSQFLYQEIGVETKGNAAQCKLTVQF